MRNLFGSFTMALEAVRRLRELEIRFEPFIPYGEDDSLKGRECPRQGGIPSRVSPGASSRELRRLSFANETAWKCDLETLEMGRAVRFPGRTKWAVSRFWRKEPKHRQTGSIRVQPGSLPDLRIRGMPVRAIDEVRWRVLGPSAEALQPLAGRFGREGFRTMPRPGSGKFPRNLP